jgi:hypothetical protein
MLGISSRSSSRKWFRKLEISPIPSLCIYSLMLFIVYNMHYFQTSSSIHEINTRCKNQLHIPSDWLPSRAVLVILLLRYSTSCHQEFQDWKDMLVFKCALRNYLLTRVCYSTEEFLSNDWLLYFFNIDHFLNSYIHIFYLLC